REGGRSASAWLYPLDLRRQTHAMTLDELRERFDNGRPYAVGIEDEVMVLDPDTLELSYRATEALEPLRDDGRFKLELPACQLVCALQVHVSAGGADRALAVYNAARSYLPLLAALGANAPFYEGVDTGLASVRPKIAQLLPRQGIPPAIAAWQEYHDLLIWGS